MVPGGFKDILKRLRRIISMAKNYISVFYKKLCSKNNDLKVSAEPCAE